MKKKTKGILIGVIAIIVAIGCAVVADYIMNGSIKERLNGLLDGTYMQQKEENKQRNKILDQIPQEDSNKAKEELINIEKNQEKSEDIVIDDETPEEEKQALEQKKLYLEITENIEKIYSKHYDKVSFDKDAEEIQSTMTGISDIYKCEEKGYVFNLNTINKYGNKYYQANTLLSVNIDDFTNFEELNEKLIDYNSKNNSKGSIIFSFNDYARCEDLNTELFKKAAFYNFGLNVQKEILAMSTNLSITNNGEAPSETYFLIKYDCGSFQSISFIQYAYKAAALSKNYDELVQFIKDSTGIIGGARSKIDYFTIKDYNDYNLDWQTFKTESEQV